MTDDTCRRKSRFPFTWRHIYSLPIRLFSLHPCRLHICFQPTICCRISTTNLSFVGLCCHSTPPHPVRLPVVVVGFLPKNQGPRLIFSGSLLLLPGRQCRARSASAILFPSLCDENRRPMDHSEAIPLSSAESLTGGRHGTTPFDYDWILIATHHQT